MKTVLKSHWRLSFRPRLELLEDRLQPSGLHFGPATFAAVPPVQVRAVSHPAVPHVNPAYTQGTVDYGTYVTGTAGAATGRGVAVDVFDDQFVTGGVNDGTNQFAYIKKYLADGTPDSTFPFVTLQVSVNGVAASTEGHGIAVDPTTGNVELVGTAIDPASANQAAFFAQYDPTGTLLNLVTYGNDTNPNSFDSVTVDTAGDVAFTGTVSVPAAGHSALTVGALPAGGSLVAISYDLPMTAGSAGLGIAIDSTGTLAYIAGSAATTPGGPQEGVFAWIDRHNPTIVNYRAVPSPAGDVIANSVAVDTTGVYFAVTTPGVAAVVEMDSTLSTFINEYDFSDPTLTVTAIGLGANGNVYVAGQTLNTGSGNLTVQLSQLDGSLNLLNTVQIGGSGTDAGLALAVKSNGSVVIAGTTNSSDFSVTDGSTLNGTTDAFLVSYTFAC